MFYIYKITNKISDKCYIGRTCQEVSVRFKQHITGMGLGKKMPIHLALSKYGSEMFTVETIFCTKDLTDCEYAEIYFINKFNSIVPNGYNVDLNTDKLKDNPYLIEEYKRSSAVQSIEGENCNTEYNPSTRTRYPVELWLEIKRLYELGETPKTINNLLNTTIPGRTMLGKLKGLGCDTSNKKRNSYRKRFVIEDSIKESIVSDFKNGSNIRDLANKFKKANKTIIRILVNEKLYVSRDKKICRPA